MNSSGRENMFSPIFCKHTPIDSVSKIAPGNILFRAVDRQLNYGIYIGNETVVIQQTPSSLEESGCEIISVNLSGFLNGAEISLCEIDDSNDLSDRLQRAESALGGKVAEGVFSQIGDDFIHWCVTGTQLGPEIDEKDDNPIFGQHFTVPFQDATHMIKAEHHGIGIENLHIIHFTDISTDHKSLQWKKSIRLTTISDFSENLTITRYNYSGMDVQWRINARNRAINALLSGNFDTYSLWFKNCKHLARWCATGNRKSEQIKNVTEALGLAALTGLSALAGKSNPIGLVKGLKKITKHFKWPWQEL